MQPRELDDEVRQDLRSLAKDTADLVARHLVMTGRLIDDDPEQALAHARAAGAMAARVGVVREAVGLAAYAAGEWADALSELRAARRITGSPDHLPLLADCERALGRPEKALAMLDDPDVARLSQDVRVELVIVAAGVRRDLGQAPAGVLLLRGPAEATTARRPWAARLWYAYADLLLAAGDTEAARAWFAKTAELDGGLSTDADERLAELEGLVFEDLEDDGEDAESPEAPAVDLDALLSAPVVPGERDHAAVEVDMSAVSEVVADDAPEVVAEPEPEPEVVAEVAQLEPAAEVVAEPEPAAEVVAEPEPAAEPEAKAEPEPGPGPEPVAEPAGSMVAPVPFTVAPEPPAEPVVPGAVPGVAFAAPADRSGMDDDDDELTLFD